MELPPLRSAVPFRPQSYDLIPYRVPKQHWEKAKRQFLQQGGVNGTNQIAAFMTGLTNTDVLPAVISQRLESLCVEESRVLMKVLELLRPPVAAAPTMRKTSITGRKFASFRGHAGDRTPRGSFRLTPRRSSLQQYTPNDEPLAPLASAVPTSTQEAVLPEVHSLSCSLRLPVDVTSSTVVARTITQLLPIDLAVEMLEPSQDALLFLQSFAKGTSTCHPRRGTGTLTLEQFAILLSYFACPTNPSTASDHNGPGTVNENIESVAALLSALPDDGTETDEVEAILASVGISSTHMLMAFGKQASSSDSPVSPSHRMPGVRSHVKELLQERQIDGEDDVLQRRTPTKRKGSVRMFMPSHSRDAALATMDLADSTSLSLSRSDKSIALQQSMSLAAAGMSGVGATPRRSPRSPMDTSATDSGWFGNAPKEWKPPVELLMEIPADIVSPSNGTITTSRAIGVDMTTQTDAVSFTLMWLGPITKSHGTSTQRSGHVGKVVSLELLKRERRERNRTKAKPENLSSLPIAQLEEMYRSMTSKRMK
ncbi:Hypothetical protein, putative [Bodo saltans]|uniref:Uncharacterized protein n=1 Tax=Bodo saltans TaxID=75058 RepID=A0A0S4J5M7_BODSA|nr:Hypothetical protein, putative [Bodo saltans]|eukprot:CUG83926.1 Hypothetical protein, putative [Bodo saltans]